MGPGVHRRWPSWSRFLCWAATGQKGTTIDLIGLLQQTIFLAVPLILGCMAGVLCERSGVINVAIEGQMLIGAFAGALFGTVAHNLGVGVLAAMIAGGLVGAAARGVLDPLPGQPGRPRRRAQPARPGLTGFLTTR